MKANAWQRFFQQQRDQHGKLVFTVTELANAAQCSRRVLNTELSRLTKRGIIMRYTQGRYGLVEKVPPEELLPFLDSSAYLTGLYALHRNNLITQVPTEMTCFTRRRHNRSRERNTAIGKFVFVCVKAGVYAHPETSSIATPEQALCDFIYMCRRQSLDARSLVTFCDLKSLNPRKLERLLTRYDRTVGHVVRQVVFGRSGKTALHGKALGTDNGRR